MFRRILTRVLAPIAAAAMLWLAVPQLAGSAHADVFWCWDDPVVSVNGHLLDIKVEQPLVNLLSMRSTALTVIIPYNTSGSVVLNDVSAFPMQTTISRTGAAWSGTGSIPVTLRVLVTSPMTYSLKLVATPLLNLTTALAAPTTRTGTSNTPLSMQVALGH